MPKPRTYHRADESTLRQWRDAGDALADFELHHRHTVKQMLDDVTADPPTEYAPPLYVIHLDARVTLYFFKRLFGPLNSITMLLDPATPKEAMILHWSKIKAWRERLERWQGGRDSGAAHYLANLKAWHQAWRRGKKADPSLSTLARWVNKEIAGTLEDALASVREAHGDTPPIPFECLFEQPSWRFPKGHWAEELACAVMLMEWWGLSRQDIHEWCCQAVENLKAGNPLFAEEDEPIDRERIWAKLKRLDANR